MSAIDCGDVIHVANLCNHAAIYWPIDEQDQYEITGLERDNGKVLNKYKLVVGGGSGEHPALVVDIDFLIWYTHRYNSNMLYDVKLFESQLSFDSWDFETCTNLHKKLQERYFEDSFESTVIYSLCALVMSEMPLEECILNGKILKFAQEYRAANLHKEDQHTRNVDGLLNVDKFGRIKKNGVLQWGYSLNDYYIDKAREENEQRNI